MYTATSHGAEYVVVFMNKCGRGNSIFRKGFVSFVFFVVRILLRQSI